MSTGSRAPDSRRGGPARGIRYARRLLRWTAFLVPRAAREDWRREWSAELSELSHRGRGEGGSGAAPGTPVPDPLSRATTPGRLALAILLDALELRRQRWTAASPLTAVGGDLRFALRSLRRAPLFTAGCVLALAMAFGALAAAFSLVNGLLLESLPFPRADRLVMLWESPYKAPGDYSTSPHTFVDWHDGAASFESLAAYAPAGLVLQGAEWPERVAGATVSADYFRAFGVEPELGRWLGAVDVEPDASPAVMLSHAFWVSRLGRDPEVLGQTLTLNGIAHRIVGVMPAGFWSFDPYSDEEPLLWTSLERQDWSGVDRGDRLLRVVGRLAGGVTIAQAAAEMHGLAESIAVRYPDSHEGWDITVVPLHTEVIDDVRDGVMVLFGAAGVLFLVACSNIANLFLARSTDRARELAVRRALGAGALRLARLQLVEAGLVAVSGALLGLVLAGWSLRAAIALGADRVPLLARVRVDASVVLATLVMAGAVGIVLGALPLLRRAGTMSGALREGGRGASESRHQRRLRDTIVGAEVALSLVLVSVAALLLHSYLRLSRVDPGFEPRGALTFAVSLPSRHDGQEGPAVDESRFFDELRHRLSEQPGVVAVGATSHLPFSGRNMTDEVRRGDGEDASAHGWQVELRRITPGYPQAIGLHLLAGREFQEQDTATATPVIIINDVLAELVFAAESPLGRLLSLGEDALDSRRIVGVVAGVKHRTLGEPRKAIAYVPVAQYPGTSLRFVVRTAADPIAFVATARAVLRQLDPAQPLQAVNTLAALVSGSLEVERFYSALLGTLAALALLLAAVGIVAVVTLSVHRRAHEIGIRVALGARSRSVVALIVRQAMVPVLAGMAVGEVAALAGGRVLGSLLYQITSTDPPTLAGASLALVVVALAASWLPARRALRVDAVEVLREG